MFRLIRHAGETCLQEELTVKTETRVLSAAALFSAIVFHVIVIFAVRFFTYEDVDNTVDTAHSHLSDQYQQSIKEDE